MHLQFWLVRHGETEWSTSGQHTGTTDLPLTLEGKLHAREIATFLGCRAFALVLTSPLQRARSNVRLHPGIPLPTWSSQRRTPNCANENFDRCLR